VLRPELAGATAEVRLTPPRVARATLLLSKAAVNHPIA